MSPPSISLILALIGAVITPVHGACDVTGPVVGSIFGTLAVVGIVLGIIAFVFYRRKKKDQEKLKKAEESLATKGHENPTFVNDLEAGSGVKTPQAKKDGGFAGYVECREYESPVKKRAPVTESANGSGPARSLFLEDVLQESTNRSAIVRKAGSRGSLDNSYPPMEPDLVVVPLLSQDIMGLGFNVDGNMKEGIFVSKIHKRGPAHDTGRISVGDRILSVTVSFENMVLEDAMTILSYSSPYPVKLCLQKASAETPSAMETIAATITNETSVNVTAENPGEDINHPVYRSQSLDDLRQINKDGLLYPRRTYSEMKKPGYIPNKDAIGETNLKKWRDRQDMVQEESASEAGDATQSSVSNYSMPDLKMDTVEVHVDGEEKIEVMSAKEEAQGVLKEAEIDETQMVAISDLNAELSLSVDDLNEGGKIVKEESITVESAPGAVADDVDAVVVSSNDVVIETTVVNGEAGSDAETASLGASSPHTDDSQEESTVRDVIRDYFGDNPNILHQFGLPSDDTVTTETTEVTKVTGDGSTVTTTTEISETESGVKSTTVVTETVSGSPDSGFMGNQPSLEVKRSSTSSSSSASSRSSSPVPKEDEGINIKRSPLINKKSTGGLSYDITEHEYQKMEMEPKASEGPKGGVAYYYSIDNHASEAHAVRPIAPKDLSIENFEQPALIRPEPNAESIVVCAAPEITTTTTTTSVTTYDGSTTTTTESVTHDHTDVNANMDHIMQLKKQIVSSNSEDQIEPQVNCVAHNNNDNNSSVTIVKQTEVTEAFTVTVNPDDSIA